MNNLYMQENNIIIDGDFILWKVVPTMKDSKDKTLEETLELLDWYLENKIFIPTNAKSYIGFLGGKGNFRKEIASSYKENRTYEYPNYFEETKKHMINKWNFIKVNNIEAEDAVGITLFKYPESIIVCEDHDLLQLPGTQYNPTKNLFLNISIEDSEYNFWKQMLTGCSTDKVKGVPKMGEVRATKILNNSINTSWEYDEEQFYRFMVLENYISYFGEYSGIEEFHKNYKLLKILREKEDFIIPNFREVTKQNIEIKSEF